MAERIRAHRERRGGGWETIEEPLDLAGALDFHARADRPILVDCLTPWLSNLMAAGRHRGRDTDGDRTAARADRQASSEFRK
jgi:adenosylcobinamide kinase/adenosylcobinamide-phosphate guanylyltransferase